MQMFFTCLSLSHDAASHSNTRWMSSKTPRLLATAVAVDCRTWVSSCVNCNHGCLYKCSKPGKDALHFGILCILLEGCVGGGGGGGGCSGMLVTGSRGWGAGQGTWRVCRAACASSFLVSAWWAASCAARRRTSSSDLMLCCSCISRLYVSATRCSWVMKVSSNSTI